MRALPTTQHDWLVYLAAWCGEMAESIVNADPKDWQEIHTLADGISTTIPVILERAGVLDLPQHYSNDVPLYGQVGNTYVWLNDPEYPGDPRQVKKVAS